MGVRPTKLHGKLDALGGVGASARRFRLPIRAKLGRFSTLTICAKPIRKDLFAGGPRAMAGFHAEVAGSSSDATTTLRKGVGAGESARSSGFRAGRYPIRHRWAQPASPPAPAKCRGAQPSAKPGCRIGCAPPAPPARNSLARRRRAVSTQSSTDTWIHSRCTTRLACGSSAHHRLCQWPASELPQPGMNKA